MVKDVVSKTLLARALDQDRWATAGLKLPRVRGYPLKVFIIINVSNNNNKNTLPKSVLMLDTLQNQSKFPGKRLLDCWWHSCDSWIQIKVAEVCWKTKINEQIHTIL